MRTAEKLSKRGVFCRRKLDVGEIFDDVSLLLVRELQAFQRELELFPDDESLWRTVPGITNSAGNLALHVSGNLQHFVGAVLGGTGYVRDREAEFSRNSGTRADVIAEIQKAIGVVREILARLPEHRLRDEYPEPHRGMKMPTGRFLLHLCTHAAFHLGQAGYLRRVITGENRTSGAVPLRFLAEP